MAVGVYRRKREAGRKDLHVVCDSAYACVQDDVALALRRFHGVFPEMPRDPESPSDLETVLDPKMYCDQSVSPPGGKESRRRITRTA